MTELTALWLPILLSAVVVFIVSSIIHMATSWHKNDYKKIPDEGKVLDALRPFGIPTGDYMAPQAASMDDMKSAEYAEKVKKGPVVILTVRPNAMWNMGATLGLWFLYSVVVGLFAAYIAGRALPVGAHYLQVFRFVGASAFMGYTFALWQQSIWYGKAWSTTIKSTIDGLLYALFTAGVFGWLWPR
ncbi:MAG: hypothetical protein CVV24_13485 [Ignavibacteriae bacterium HGW-Ignavibacteriae-3]|nr:MAG: hypothetical protein CVV24_13485 [Ignavibacteriae bacterium HGW-Ignavibacteriae-3]